MNVNGQRVECRMIAMKEMKTKLKSAMYGH
jgi:hypothetical protein